MRYINMRCGYNQPLHENSHLMTRELAEKMKYSHTAIEKDLHAMGKVQKCGACVAYFISEEKKSTSHNLR